MFGGSERAPGYQRRRNGLIVRPNVDNQYIRDKSGLCKAAIGLARETTAARRNCDGVPRPKSTGWSVIGHKARMPLDSYQSVGAKPSSQFAKRNKPVDRFIPQHEPNARQTLAQSEATDIR